MTRTRSSYCSWPTEVAPASGAVRMFTPLPQQRYQAGKPSSAVRSSSTAVLLSVAGGCPDAVPRSDPRCGADRSSSLAQRSGSRLSFRPWHEVVERKQGNFPAGFGGGG
ncbi:hypothetical protein LH612_34750, partial [Klebsiella pneumoniae]|nr:hypothetical protein [Klebsiella pneumoniae]